MKRQVSVLHRDEQLPDDRAIWRCGDKRWVAGLRWVNCPGTMNFGDPCTLGAIYCPWIEDFEHATPFATVENDVGFAGDEARLRDIVAMRACRITQRENGVPASRWRQCRQR